MTFADRLEAALTARGIDVKIDRTAIEKGEEWWRRIKELIGGSDTIVFAMCPGSLTSKVCQDEIDFAVGLNKRLVPVVVEDWGSVRVPDALSKLNYVYFAGRERVGATGGFDAGLEELIRAIDTDIDWIREHTRLGEQAQRWHDNGRRTDQMLRGNELAEAQIWRDRRPAKVPEATALVRELIVASRLLQEQELVAERSPLPSGIRRQMIVAAY